MEGCDQSKDRESILLVGGGVGGHQYPSATWKVLLVGGSFFLRGPRWRTGGGAASSTMLQWLSAAKEHSPAMLFAVV
jgi:hypothetical protein